MIHMIDRNIKLKIHAVKLGIIIFLRTNFQTQNNLLHIIIIIIYFQMLLNIMHILHITHTCYLTTY